MKFWEMLIILLQILMQKQIFIFRFPCQIADCNKEYRTQWELNSHHRLKHATSVITQDQPLDQYTIELYNTLNDDQPSDSARTSASTFSIDQVDNEHLPANTNKHILNGQNDRTDVSMTKRKNRNNNQQIIYILPGPVIENVNICLQNEMN